MWLRLDDYEDITKLS